MRINVLIHAHRAVFLECIFSAFLLFCSLLPILYTGVWTEDQAADLGHCRARALPGGDAVVLPRGSRCSARLRRCPSQHIQPSPDVAQRCPRPHKPKHGSSSCSITGGEGGGWRGRRIVCVCVCFCWERVSKTEERGGGDAAASI